MIKKTFLSLLALTAVLTFAQSSQLEARNHHHCRSCSSTSLRVNVGTAINDRYVTTRRFAQPVIVAAPVYAPQPYYPVYPPVYAPVYSYQVPTYVEEVYVERAPRMIGLGGLSFSWNFFK